MSTSTQIVDGDQLRTLIERLEAFYRHEALPARGFQIAEFRDDQRRVMVVVEEWC